MTGSVSALARTAPEAQGLSTLRRLRFSFALPAYGEGEGARAPSYPVRPTSRIGSLPCKL